MTATAPTHLGEQQPTEPGREPRKHPHLLDQFIPDPSGLMPLYDEPGFAALLEIMVADEAPRLFAIVQEYGQRVDARIAAWGIAFDEGAEVVGGRAPILQHGQPHPRPAGVVQPGRRHTTS